MVTWLISPPAETSWRGNRDDLIRCLRRDYPDVRFHDRDSDSRAELIWELQIGGSIVLLRQHRDGQAQGIQGDALAIAEYAAWWRRQVPAEQALILFDEGLNTVVELRPEIAPGEVVAGMAT